MSDDQPAADTHSNLPLSRIAIYGSIGLPAAMFGYPIAIWVPPVYAGQLGLSLAAIGTMLLLARITDIVTDPLIGTWSDRSQMRLGRRKPFMLMGMPVAVIGVLLLFMPKILWGGVPGSWYLLVSVAVMYLGSTLIFIPYGAWGAEMSPDYHERSRITAIRELFTLVGLFAAASIPFALEIYGIRDYAKILEGMGWAIVFLLPAAILFVCWRVPETKAVGRQKIPLKEGLRLVVKNGPMVRVLMINFIIVGGETFRNALSVMFMRDIVGVPTIGIYFLYYFSAGLIAIPFWLRLGKKMGKHRAFAVCLTIVSFISVSMVALGQGDTTPFLILFILKGACFGGLQFLPLAMLADVVDVDTARSRGKRAGTFFAISGMVGKFAAAIGTSLPLFILGWVGFNASGEQGVNTALQLNFLAFNYAIMPAVFFMGALWLTWHYPLTPERHERLRGFLERRAARQEAVAQEIEHGFIDS